MLLPPTLTQGILLSKKPSLEKQVSIILSILSQKKTCRHYGLTFRPETAFQKRISPYLSFPTMSYHQDFTKWPTSPFG